MSPCAYCLYAHYLSDVCEDEQVVCILNNGSRIFSKQNTVSGLPFTGFFIILSSSSDFPFLSVAPYEADAQLAFLNLSGIAQVVITEDSDLIVFGSKSVSNFTIMKQDNILFYIGLFQMSTSYGQRFCSYSFLLLSH